MFVFATFTCIAAEVVERSVVCPAPGVIGVGLFLMVY